MRDYLSENIENKTKFLEHLPSTINDVLTENILHAKQAGELIMYAGEFTVNKNVFQVLTFIIIASLLSINIIFGMMIGARIMSIIIAITIAWLIRKFYHQVYYMFIMLDEIAFIPRNQPSDYFRISGSDLESIYTSIPMFSIGAIRFCITEDSADSLLNSGIGYNAINSQFRIVYASESGDLHNVQYALLRTAYADALYNGALIRDDLNISPKIAPLREPQENPYYKYMSGTTKTKYKPKQVYKNKGRIMKTLIVIATIIILAISASMIIHNQNYRYRNFRFVGAYYYFHKPNCKIAERIPPEDLETFKTIEEASSVYDPCDVCITWDFKK